MLYIYTELHKERFCNKQQLKAYFAFNAVTESKQAPEQIHYITQAS